MLRSDAKTAEGDGDKKTMKRLMDSFGSMQLVQCTARFHLEGFSRVALRSDGVHELCLD